jgi:phosphatidylglycerophosphatase A
LVFFIWRLFDIIKPFPARNLEKLKGGLGIMIDDVISSFYSLILIHFILIIFKIG